MTDGRSAALFTLQKKHSNEQIVANCPRVAQLSALLSTVMQCEYIVQARGGLKKPRQFAIRPKLTVFNGLFYNVEKSEK
jgi:hypothetical protein